MTSKFFIFAFLLTTNFLSAQDSLNMVRLARWDDDSLPLANPGGLNLQYSGCWGLAIKGREYAVIGGARHVLFFDVTKPTQPKLVGKFEGTKTNIWREFKSYKNRLYAVSDQTTEGLMIFDLSNTPATGEVKQTYWSNEFFNAAHTITLDTLSGLIYLNGTNVASQGMLVLSVKNNPDKPELIANIQQLTCGYIHDSYVRRDTLYASSGYSGLCVYDFKDPKNPKFLASEATGGYNHNNWLTINGHYAFYTEEVPRGRPIRLVDLKDLKNGEIKSVYYFLDNLLEPNLADTLKMAVPHNIYIQGHLLFDSQYEDGLLVYDISNPLLPVLVARYDTHPENTVYNGYFGCWGNYPWLPSGTIITSDMQNGLSLFRLKIPVSSTQAPNSELQAAIYPNPASEEVFIRLPNAVDAWVYRLLNPAGQVLRSGTVTGHSEASLRVREIPAGLYFIEIRSNDGKSTMKRVIVE